MRFRPEIFVFGNRAVESVLSPPLGSQAVEVLIYQLDKCLPNKVSRKKKILASNLFSKENNYVETSDEWSREARKKETGESFR